MDDPIAAQRDDALREVRVLRAAATAYADALEGWYVDHNDVSAMVAQHASVRLANSLGRVMDRVKALYDAGVIGRRPGMDLTEDSDGESKDDARAVPGD